MPSAIVRKQNLYQFSPSIVSQTESSQASIEEAFRAQKLVPDVIPAAPGKLLKITYGSEDGSKAVEVTLGNKIAARQVRTEPKFDLTGYGDSDLCSIIFIGLYRFPNPKDGFII